MRIRKPSGPGASPLPGSSGSYRNGKVCPRCKRFGTYAPNSIVCDRCQGALPLIFTVAVASSVTAGALVVSISVVAGGDQR
jgi:hypothetical protein